jgi:OPA family glycerol-3-phosphate transporter-like MFS transporter/OPA family sugar phosphate sensor protein UhpC-like MFS transporter
MKDEKSFRIAQNKFIVYSAIVYAFFYLTRKNLSMAMPGMMEEGVISTYAVGTMLSLHGILYGLSRFVNGFWADRLNGRIFMTIGLALSAVMNFCFGCTSLSVLFAIFWIVNGWTQGMGFPPCAKMLTHWIHPKELATKMSAWNTSHSFGAVMALGLCSLLLYLGFGWRWCFYVPAVLAGLIAVFCFFKVKESPAEAGVEELDIEGAAAAEKGGSEVTTKDRMRLVFCNKVIWMVALSNFFVYIVRFGFLDWGPTFLKQYKGIPVSKGGLMIIAFEVAAIVGTIFAGWATDKWFKGRGVRTCVFCMLFTALCAFGFWFLPQGAPIWQATLLLMGAGFFIYGPQALIGITVANQATKDAAAMANGFTGIMGYLSTLVSGIGIAFMKETFGWGAALFAIAATALFGMVILLFAWNAKANGYKNA